MPLSFLSRWRYRRLIRRVRRLKNAGPEAQQMLNERGVYLLPRDYYSCIPTAAEVQGSFEYRAGALPYLDERLFDRARLAGFLEELRPFAREFTPPRQGDFARPAEFYWENGFFGGGDALSYYCIIRRFRPRRILEIGCGFSTLVALAALQKNGAGELVCVEPYPRAFLRGRPGIKQLVEKKAEDVPLEFFQEQLGDGDILFLDTTHTVKTGGDCVYLYLKVLPYLKAKALIHSHDIFLPEAMPIEWQLKKQLYLTEQYLLLALLLENPRFEVLYGSNYHRLLNREQFAAFNGTESKAEGGSFWYRRC